MYLYYKEWGLLEEMSQYYKRVQRKGIYRISINELFFFIGVLIYSFESIVYQGSYVRMLLPDFFEQILKYSALTIFIFVIIISKKSKKNTLTQLIIVPLFALMTILISDTEIIIMVAALFASQGISFRKIIKNIRNFDLIWFLFVIILSILKVIPNNTFTHLSNTAYSLGFFYYSNISVLVFWISVMSLYLKGINITYIDIAFFVFANYIAYMVATTRLQFFMSLLFVILLLIVRNKTISEYIAKITNLNFIVMFSISVILSYAYAGKNQFISQLNILLLNRIKFSYYALKDTGISLFGKKILTISPEKVNGILDFKNYFYVDSGYIYTLVEYGIIFTIFVILAYTIIINYAVQSNNKVIYLWCLITSLYSLINNCITNIVINPLLFLVIPLFLKRKYINKKNKV